MHTHTHTLNHLLAQPLWLPLFIHVGLSPTPPNPIVPLFPNHWSSHSSNHGPLQTHLGLEHWKLKPIRNSHIYILLFLLLLVKLSDKDTFQWPNMHVHNFTVNFFFGFHKSPHPTFTYLELLATLSFSLSLSSCFNFLSFPPPHFLFSLLPSECYV